MMQVFLKEILHFNRLIRYVKYLDHVNRTLVYMLAAMGSWRDDEAEYVGKKIFSGLFPAELFASMIKHSFIKTNEDHKHRMHSVVVNSLLSEIRESTLNAVNAELFHYRIMQLGGINSFRDVLSNVDDAVNCFCKISKPDIYESQYSDFRMLTNRIQEIRRKWIINDSLRLSTTLVKHCATVFQNTDYYGESLLIQGDSLWYKGDYNQAFEHDKSSYTLRLNILGEDNPDTLNSLHCLGVDYRTLGYYDNALAALKKAYKARKRVLGEDHPDTLSSLHKILRE